MGNGNNEQRRTSILEIADELIFHMNDARMRFMVLSFSSLIVAPISILVALVFIAHPLLLRVLLFRLPSVGWILLPFLVLTIVMSTVWLYVGLKEYRFLSRWNDRFMRFMSLRENVERQIQKQLEEADE